MLVAGSEFSVTVRRGEVEKLIEAGSRTLGLRVFKDGRSSSTYSADLTPASLDRFVNRALDLASIADPDPFAGLPAWEERPGRPRPGPLRSRAAAHGLGGEDRSSEALRSSRIRLRPEDYELRRRQLWQRQRNAYCW